MRYFLSFPIANDEIFLRMARSMKNIPPSDLFEFLIILQLSRVSQAHHGLFSIDCTPSNKMYVSHPTEQKFEFT